MASTVRGSQPCVLRSGREAGGKVMNFQKHDSHFTVLLKPVNTLGSC